MVSVGGLHESGAQRTLAGTGRRKSDALASGVELEEVK
jgi:hypothetical protein